MRGDSIALCVACALDGAATPATTEREIEDRDGEGHGTMEWTTVALCARHAAEIDGESQN